MIDCQACRTKEDRKDCIGKYWYSPGMIKYCFNQIFWLIQTFAKKNEKTREWEIWSDFWPPDINNSEQVNSLRYACPFEDTVCVIAEFNYRLKKAGKDGKWLVDKIASGTECVEDLNYDTKQALIYMAGNRRKHIDYSLWRAQRRYKNIEKNENLTKPIVNVNIKLED